MKKIMMLVLSAVLLCSSMALAEGGGVIVGMIDSIGTSIEIMDQTAVEHFATEHGATTMEYDIKGCPNLSSALLDLSSGKIQILAVPDFCGQYIASRNEGLVSNAPKNSNQIGFSMMTMEDDEEIYNILNSAIVQLKENGTIEALRQEHIVKCCEGAQPEAVVLPVLEGRDTISVAVTGDVPPMDYVSSDGAPAGFNLALLAEIAKLAQVNVEVVTVEAQARATALAADKVDAIFWVGTLFCPDEDHDFAQSEKVDHTIVTQFYLDAPYAFVTKMP